MGRAGQTLAPTLNPNPQKKENGMTPAYIMVGLLLALTLPHVLNATTQGDTRLFPGSHHARSRGTAELGSALQNAARATTAAQDRQVLEGARTRAAFAPAPPFWLASGSTGAFIPSDFPQFGGGGRSRIEVNRGESR